MGWEDITGIQPAAFDHIDEYTDSFSVIGGVVSDRLAGDPTAAGKPWLSVVIPTYRRDDLLREALSSALRQQTVDFAWEIVVTDNTPLDDGGETPALRVVRELNDPRILYYHNRENVGSGYNWNRGAELARGEWLCFLHDDDVLLPGALRSVGRQIRAYRGKRPLGYIHARRLEFSGEPASCAGMGERRRPAERLSRFGAAICGSVGAGAPTCGTAIRRRAYLETGGVNYAFGPSADAVLCYQIMRRWEVRLSDRVLGGYRWGGNESLNRETLLSMIRSDELLAGYAYGQSAFTRWWGGVFGAAASWWDIRAKNRIAARYGVPLTKKDLADATAYPEPGTVKKGIFFAAYAAYRLCRLLAGELRGLGGG